MTDKKFYQDKASYLVALEQSLMTSERILETLYRLHSSQPKETKEDVEEIEASIRRTLKITRKCFEAVEQKASAQGTGV